MRIRTIKPDFWLHEDLAATTPLHRLLFIGLWQMADKEGRLEFRPLRIRAALFPYEPVEVGVLIEELAVAGFLQIYGEHREFLFIPGFKEHQRPHPKEPISTLPVAPIQPKAVKRNGEPGKGFHASRRLPAGREGKGMDNGKGREPDVTTPPPSAPTPVSRHKETVDRLWATFKAKRGSTYVPVPRDADFKAVKEMLAAGQTPEAIDDAWVRGLAHVGYPTISSLVELQQHFGKFSGTGPPSKPHIGPIDAATQSHGQTGWVNDF